MKVLLLFLVLQLSVACGSDDDDSDNVVIGTPEEQTAECPDFHSFETRLRTNLLISGVECSGGEILEIPGENGPEIIECQRNQWLVTVDNQNTCTIDGVCTEIFVTPVVSNLTEASVSNPPERGCSYDIVPLGPLTPEQLQEVRQHEIRVPEEGVPEVIPRELVIKGETSFSDQVRTEWPQ